jgi:TatA/E family protein of Tat protein translocase
MFGIGIPELLLILAIALIVIGPKKLPDLAKSMGRALNEFKKATSEFKDSLDIDDDVKNLKKPFNDINNDIRGALRKTTRKRHTETDIINSAPPLPESTDASEKSSTSKAETDE